MAFCPTISKTQKNYISTKVPKNDANFFEHYEPAREPGLVTHEGTCELLNPEPPLAPGL